MKINAQIEYTLFSGPKKVALVGEKFIEETSGMVVSRKTHPGYTFTMTVEENLSFILLTP